MPDPIAPVTPPMVTTNPAGAVDPTPTRVGPTMNSSGPLPVAGNTALQPQPHVPPSSTHGRRPADVVNLRVQPGPDDTGLGRRKLADGFAYDGSGMIKVLFLDADGTLRKTRSGQDCPNTPDDQELLPGVAAKVQGYVEQGYLIAIVSNQGGIAHGYMTLASGDANLAETVRLLAEAGATVHYYDFAEGYDESRKPKTGMADRLERTLKERFGAAVQIDRAASLMVGDAAYKRGELRPDGREGTSFSNSDRLFAVNARLPFVEACDFFAWG